MDFTQDLISSETPDLVLETPCTNPSLSSKIRQAFIAAPLIFATKITSEPTSLDNAILFPDWPQWRTTLEVEYNLLRKHHVFGKLST